MEASTHDGARQKLRRNRMALHDEGSAARRLTSDNVLVFGVRRETDKD
jgi:hypothetical protein